MKLKKLLELLKKADPEAEVYIDAGVESADARVPLDTVTLSVVCNVAALDSERVFHEVTLS